MEFYVKLKHTVERMSHSFFFNSCNIDPKKQNFAESPWKILKENKYLAEDRPSPVNTRSWCIFNVTVMLSEWNDRNKINP